MNQLSEMHRRTSTAAKSISDETVYQYISVSLSGAAVAAPVQRWTVLGETTVYQEDKLLWYSAFNKV